MNMSINKLTLDQALAGGYTHFWLCNPKSEQEEFEIFILSQWKLEWAFKRCSNKEFDEECEAEDMEAYFGHVPYLCARPESPQVTAEQLCDKISDIFEDDDRYVPSLLVTMFEKLAQEDKFKEGVTLINKAMGEYKSFSDAGICVVLK